MAPVLDEWTKFAIFALHFNRSWPTHPLFCPSYHFKYFNRVLTPTTCIKTLIVLIVRKKMAVDLFQCRNVQSCDHIFLDETVMQVTNSLLETKEFNVHGMIWFLEKSTQECWPGVENISVRRVGRDRPNAPLQYSGDRYCSDRTRSHTTLSDEHCGERRDAAFEKFAASLAPSWNDRRAPQGPRMRRLKLMEPIPPLDLAGEGSLSGTTSHCCGNRADISDVAPPACSNRM
jgi:hypothetical protein